MRKASRIYPAHFTTSATCPSKHRCTRGQSQSRLLDTIGCSLPVAAFTRHAFAASTTRSSDCEGPSRICADLSRRSWDFCIGFKRTLNWVISSCGSLHNAFISAIIPLMHPTNLLWDLYFDRNRGHMTVDAMDYRGSRVSESLSSSTRSCSVITNRTVPGLLGSWVSYGGEGSIGGHIYPILGAPLCLPQLF